MKKISAITFISIFFAWFAVNISVANEKNLIYKIDIKKEIDKTSQIYLSKGLYEAQELNADAVQIGRAHV